VKDRLVIWFGLVIAAATLVGVLQWAGII